MAELNKEAKQKLFLGVMLVGGLLYAGYTYAYSPRSDELVALEARLQSLQDQNRTARALVEQGGESEVERQLGEYREQLVRVEGLIPSSEELPDLLDAIAVEAQRTGVELALIQPTGASEGEFYTRRTYDLAVLGSYHPIGEFLTRVGSLPRIITPIDLNLTVQEATTRNGDPRLEARFTIETYVLPSSGSLQSEVPDVE